VEHDARFGKKIHLIASEDDEPRVKLIPGKRYEVVVTQIVDSNLQAIAEEADHPAARPARLCRSRTTCIAIVELDSAV